MASFGRRKQWRQDQKRIMEVAPIEASRGREVMANNDIGLPTFDENLGNFIRARRVRNKAISQKQNKFIDDPRVMGKDHLYKVPDDGVSDVQTAHMGYVNSLNDIVNEDQVEYRTKDPRYRAIEDMMRQNAAVRAQTMGGAQTSALGAATM